MTKTWVVLGRDRWLPTGHAVKPWIIAGKQLERWGWQWVYASRMGIRPWIKPSHKREIVGHSGIWPCLLYPHEVHMPFGCVSKKGIIYMQHDDKSDKPVDFGLAYFHCITKPYWHPQVPVEVKFQFHSNGRSEPGPSTSFFRGLWSWDTMMFPVIAVARQAWQIPLQETYYPPSLPV